MVEFYDTLIAEPRFLASALVTHPPAHEVREDVSVVAHFVLLITS